MTLKVVPASSSVAPIQIGRNLANANIVQGIARHLRIPVSDPTDLHVTLMWSRVPVDWTHKAFLPRIYPIIVDSQMMKLERFGDLAVLTFESKPLISRHKALVAAGARSDHKDFKPHITLGPWPAHAEPQNVPLKSPIVLSGEYRKPAKV